jgi:hypothetical protein
MMILTLLAATMLLGLAPAPKAGLLLLSLR